MPNETETLYSDFLKTTKHDTGAAALLTVAEALLRQKPMRERRTSIEPPAPSVAPIAQPVSEPIDTAAFVRQYTSELTGAIIGEVRNLMKSERRKEWYTTEDLSAATGKSAFTIREKWCNAGRIVCEKEPGTGKWRIPCDEYERLLNGGALLPKR